MTDKTQERMCFAGVDGGKTVRLTALAPEVGPTP